MKIAIIRQRYNPFGGAERFVERALGALSAQGAEITLITRNWDGAPDGSFRQLTCDPPYGRLWGGRLARDRSFARAVQDELARGDYDITQSHERIPGCMIFRAGDGVHAAWLDHRARMLNPFQRFVQGRSSFHRYLLKAERETFTHPALRAIICNSNMVADELVQYYGVDRSKLHVIYNGVDTDSFHPSLAERYRTGLRRELAIGNDVPVLLHVGSGFQRKGVPQLLGALAGLPHQRAILLIVGADRQLASMRRLAERLGLGERVRFVGGVGDVRPYLGAADGFVLPTLYDPCPNAALEALASGLPIVTSLQCGAKEFVSEELNGRVADALDQPALIDALSWLCSVAGDAGVRAAARAAVEGLTLEVMSERLIRLYENLLIRRGV